ncbi:MAG: hypothetical protein LBJ42_01810, partial [Holosporales bacterium]|nr:hypothetical protein [Holosporales bacterium]
RLVAAKARSPEVTGWQPALAGGANGLITDAVAEYDGALGKLRAQIDELRSAAGVPVVSPKARAIRTRIRDLETKLRSDAADAPEQKTKTERFVDALKRLEQGITNGVPPDAIAIIEGEADALRRAAGIAGEEEAALRAEVVDLEDKLAARAWTKVNEQDVISGLVTALGRLARAIEQGAAQNVINRNREAVELARTKSGIYGIGEERKSIRAEIEELKEALSAGSAQKKNVTALVAGLEKLDKRIEIKEEQSRIAIERSHNDDKPGVNKAITTLKFALKGINDDDLKSISDDLKRINDGGGGDSRSSSSDNEDW